MDFLVVDAENSVAIMGRGAHGARTPGQPYAGPPSYRPKNIKTSTFFCQHALSPRQRRESRSGNGTRRTSRGDACSSTWTFLSSTLRPVGLRSWAGGKS
eukprot:8203701-Pyramimonas_sp.AAC.1